MSFLQMGPGKIVSSGVSGLWLLEPHERQALPCPVHP